MRSLFKKTWFHSPENLFLLFSLLYILQVYLSWPGTLRPDSLLQLQQASLGMFSDHHPPLMAVWWRCLSFISPSPGMMLMMHLLLLYSAAFIFSLTVQDSLWRYFYVLSLAWPQVAFYSTFLLKDIGFTFSFLCAASILALSSTRQKVLTGRGLTLVSVLLFYGTAVKFQGVFILSMMTYWIALCASQSSSFMKKIVQGTLLFIMIAGGVELFNATMTDKKDHSWQFVKMYDLVAIGLQENKDLLPDFVKNGALFSEDDIKKKFSSERVDSLVFDTNPPLIRGKTENERNILWMTWARAVLDFPKAYFTHRWHLFYNLISKPLVKCPASMQSDPELLPVRLKGLLYCVDSWGLMTIIEKASPFKFYLPFVVLYFLVGFYYRTKRPYAIPLMFLNGVGLLLLAVLFIFSMASEGRYIYLTVCFFHFSHPFFFKTLWSLKRRA